MTFFVGFLLRWLTTETKGKSDKMESNESITFDRLRQF